MKISFGSLSGTSAILIDDLIIEKGRQSTSSNILVNNNGNQTDPSDSSGLGIFILLVVGGIILYYFSKRGNKKKYIYNNRYSQGHPPNSVGLYGIQLNELQNMWYCPFNNEKLQEYVNPTAQNSYFLITRSNTHGGIQNAISMRKIPLEASQQTEQLASYLFSKSNISEITLVSTKCPHCNRSFSTPKI